MVIWFLSCIIDILFNIICYITNPIVCLFANEVGELPEKLYWWSNWDDGLDIEWMVTEHCVPKFVEYDFNKHYKYHSPSEVKAATGIEKGYVDLLDPNFTLKERFQRYVCRLVWMYRNCGYGFSYAVTGALIDYEKIIVEMNEGAGTREPLYFGHYEDLFFDPFCIKVGKGWSFQDIKWLSWVPIKKHFLAEAYLGYKFYFMKPGEKERCMLTISAWPFGSYK